MSKLKILLAVEDFKDHSELVELFHKVGWDVKSVKRDILVKDEIFSFNPDFLILSGLGRQINGIKLAKTLYRKNGRPFLALFLSPSESGKDALKGVPADAVIEKPFEPIRILRVLCKVSGIDESSVLTKFQKLNSGGVLQDSASEITHIQGSREDSPQMQHLSGGEGATDDSEMETQPRRNWLSDSYRKKLYDDIVSAVDENALNEWDLSEIKSAQQALHESHTPDLDVLDDQRRDFVKALFKRD